VGKGSDFMKRLPLVMALVMVFVFGVSVNAAPYPYGEYTLENGGDLNALFAELEDAYTVPVKAEGDSYYPWDASSFAILMAPALIDVGVTRQAEHQLWTDAEKEEMRQNLSSYYIENKLFFAVTLTADQEVLIPGVLYDRNYVEIGSHKSYIDRIVLETDVGQRYTPTHQTNDDSKPREQRLGVSALNFVGFPRYDNGVQIINEDTKWIRLWVIAGAYRIYFQFDFDM